MKTKNGVTISLSNAKLGGFIPSINLPPVITCREGAPCSRDCYACRGNFRFESVKKCHRENFVAFVANPTAYFADVIAFLENGLVTYRFFRWHSSGDIVSPEYFAGMVQVAQACPGTHFLAFTKKFEIINDFLKGGGSIPSNLSIIFSAWDKSFNVPNPYGLPVAYVNFKDESKTPVVPVTAFHCGGNCEKCLTCWSLQKGQTTVFNQH